MTVPLLCLLPPCVAAWFAGSMLACAYLVTASRGATTKGACSLRRAHCLSVGAAMFYGITGHCQLFLCCVFPLQERLEAAERAGAGEEERYQHTTAELHEQLEQQAGELVECQHRCVHSGHKRCCCSHSQSATPSICMSPRTDSAYLRLCRSCQQAVQAGRSVVSCSLALACLPHMSVVGLLPYLFITALCRIANLKEELEASKQRLENEQENEAQLARRAQQLEQEAAAAGQQLQQAGVDASSFPAAAVALPEGAAAPAAFPVGWSTGAAPQQAEAAAPTVVEAPKTTRAGRWAALLGSVDEEASAASAAGQQQQSSSQVVPPLPLQQLQQQHEGAAPGAPGHAAYEALDMTAVRKHVEDMAAQYVAGLRKAEAELQAVRSVWQQAEDELAAMRSSPRTSPRTSNNNDRAGSRTASPRVSVTGADSSAPAGAADAAAGPARVMTPNGKVAASDFDLVRAPSPAIAPQVTVSGSSHAGADAEHSVATFVVELPSPRFGGGHVGNFPKGHPRATSSNAPNSHGRAPPAAAAAAVERTEAEQYASEALHCLQRAAAEGASAGKTRVCVRMVPEAAASDSSYSSASSWDEAGSVGSCSSERAA